MALGVYFAPVSMTKQQYDEIISRLNAAGAGSPAGREYHACFGEEPKLHVFDVWTSQAALDAFMPALQPVLAAVGVDPGQPMVEAIHTVIPGK